MLEDPLSAVSISAVTVQPARPADIPALLALEGCCFTTDRLTRRSFRYLVSRARAITLVAMEDAAVAGYAVVLFHGGTSLARLYSFAVAPERRGRGIGGQLLRAAEQAAQSRGCLHLRLEVRRDNASAISLYRHHGFHEFGVSTDYYEDHMEALRMEKRIPGPGGACRAGAMVVPYYRQTLDFTCGPAALMMGMKAIRPDMELNRRLELQIWREATTVFMTSGHGGSSPYGLALAAWRRGFDVDVWVKDDSVPFLDGVRRQDKKEVMRLVHQEMMEALHGTGIRVRYGAFTTDDMAQAVENNAVPIVLISSYRIYREKFPHWVVVAGQDTHFLYVHDPLVDERRHRDIDRVAMPVARQDFERMAQYGRAGLKATVTLREQNPRRHPSPR